MRQDFLAEGAHAENVESGPATDLIVLKMDASPIIDSGAIELPLRGIKRKATSTAAESAKRVRGHETHTDFGSPFDGLLHGKH